MTITELQTKWTGLKPESKGSFKSLRISSDCIPDLYIGVDHANVRCLILKLPTSHSLDFQSIIKQNLSIELFRETHWIILKLTNVVYSDLFNDLILSLYNKIEKLGSVKEYTTIFIETFYKWSEFFEDNSTNRLSEETIFGIFGELQFLKDVIEQKNTAFINDLLLSWRGPYDTGHDFIFLDQNVEVKTKEQSNVDIRISSEYQLEAEPNKPLTLAVINVLKNNNGISLHDIVMSIRQLIIERLGDFTIVLKGLAQKGLTLVNLSEYDNYRFTSVNIVSYDCTHEHFPKIINSQLSDFISSVKYNIRVNALDTFITGRREL